MEKEFKSINEQIEILKSRNINIENYDKARDMLLNNNYYYLINGYKHPFLDRSVKYEKFIEGTQLEELYYLYEFDRKIRIIFLEYILQIERKIDTYIAYEFSKEHGYKEYLISNNFKCINKNKENIKKLINDINLEISNQYKNSNKMIVHYLNKYNYIPLWVLVRILSFGKISKFYSFMKQKEQNKISRKFNVRSEELKVYLMNLGNIRNICAHDEKLYDVRLKNRIKTTIYHNKLRLMTNNSKMLATRDLFSIIIVLKLLLEKENFERFYKEIMINIDKLSKQLKTISINKVLYRMGFPKNYKKLLKM